MKTEPIHNPQDLLEKTRNRILEAEIQARRENHLEMVVAVTAEFIQAIDLATMMTTGHHFVRQDGILQFAGHKLKQLPGPGICMVVAHRAG